MTYAELRPFEGMWLASPSGLIACAKIIKGELRIPYTNAGKPSLAGHFYKCRVMGGVLFGRFQRFNSGESGVLFLTVGENFTLKGGWWTDESIPDNVRQDVSLVNEDLPGMVRTVWIRMPKAKKPAWAAQYFLEWPPDERENHR